MIDYSKDPICNKIIFFIYDPNKRIDNKYAFEDGLGNKCDVDDKSVEIITIIKN